MLKPGARLAHYEIVAAIGAGGMGEVYRARDTKLERDVALKLLPDELAADADRLARFKQEARSASSLDHPNIITIHDIVEDTGRHVIVMQYVSGKTLGELMSTRRLPLAQTLDYAIQVADGLSRAHARDIVHRDLKPDNVMVTEDGVVKILDFGLAKLAESAPNSESKTRDQAKPSTTDGSIVGTAPYMSPEQVEGAPLDARSDIFSFGSMLYEMLTGRRAFTGKSTMDTMSSILKDEPEKLSSLVPSIPMELDRIVTRALRKDPNRRLQSLADVRVVLQEILDELSSGEAVTADELERARRRPGLSQAAIAAIAVSLAGLVGFAVWLLGDREPPPALLSVPLTAYDGDEQDPALSSTGDRVAFTRNVAPGDPPQLLVKTLEGNALQLTHLAEPVLTPTWSPDDTRIAYITHGTDRGDEIFEIDALGGEPRRLVTGASIRGEHGLSWSPDGRSLAYPDRVDDSDARAIFLLSLDSGERRQVTSPPPEGIDTLPAFSGDGTRLAFARHVGGFPRDDIYIQTIDDASSEKQLTFVKTPILGVGWTGDDRYVVYSRVRTLWRVRATGGEPEKLPVGDHAAGLALSRDQSTLVYTESKLNTNIWRAPGPLGDKAEPTTPWISSAYREWYPEYSPDGESILVESFRAGTPRLFECDAGGRQCSRLTRRGDEGAQETQPQWSPDGETIAYTSFDGTATNIYVIDAQGELPRALTDNAAQDFHPRWSHDGQSILYASNAGEDVKIWRIPTGGGEASPVTTGPGLAPFESDDGDTVYYHRDNTIWSVPSNGGEEAQVLDHGGIPMFEWTLWSHYLIYVKYDDGPLAITQFDLDTGESEEMLQLGPEVRISLGIDVSPDGKWILMSQHEPSNSNLMLVENFR